MSGTGLSLADTGRIRRDPALQAFWILRIGFTVAPILFGLDKFAGLLTDWEGYLAPAFDRSFDMREALRVHARGICRAVEVQDASPKDRAFAILAEMLLLQHTCHWYCRSKSVASARMLARHRTSHEQLVGAVLPETRQEYLGLVA